MLRFEHFLSRITDVGIDDNGIGVEVGDDDVDFSDPDYNLSDDDEDFQDTMAEQQVQKCKGRPKNTTGSEFSIVPSSTSILVPEKIGDNESDYADSDELDDISDKEGDSGQGNDIYEEYDEAKHVDNPSLELGMKFGNFDQFKKACMDWGIKNRFQLCFPTNDKRRVICACKEDGCSFRVYASAVSRHDPTVQIKTLNLTHEGGNVFDNFHLSPQYIAKKYLDIFRADSHWSTNGLIAMVQRDFSYTISKEKAGRARRQALKWINGEEGLQYNQLLSYRAELLNSNPGSNVVVWRNEGKFLGFYVCLGALKEAFKSGCRPLVSLDGCWLKGAYGGNLLSAVAIDPNDCIFPVAYAVIAGSESKETWSWFLENLGDDLEITNSHHIAFMSDRQKGLIGAVKDLFPNAEHRNCVRHMYQNFRQKHNGKHLNDLVWNAARASNKVIFNKCMEEIEKVDKEAREWFNHPERPFESWTRALFKTHSRCDMLLNNLCESFNRYILDAREKAIITMLEMIKNQLMKRLYKKRQWIAKYRGTICPKIDKKLKKINLESVLFKPDYSGGPKVLVDGPGGINIVDMVGRSCTCRRWDLTRLPCPHAYISIIGNNERVEDYVNSYYKVETFKNVYSHYINPTNPKELWPEVLNGGDIFPPKMVKKKRGRPSKARKKESEELEKQKKAKAAKKCEKRAEEGSEMGPQKLSKKGYNHVKCSICKMYGHNARGHHKFVITGETSSRVGEAEFDDLWNNNNREFNSTNQSILTEGAIEDHTEANPIGVETFICSSIVVDDVSTTNLEQSVGKETDMAVGPSSISMRGRRFKRKVMKEFVIAAQKRKTRDASKK